MRFKKQMFAVLLAVVTLVHAHPLLHKLSQHYDALHSTINNLYTPSIAKRVFHAHLHATRPNIIRTRFLQKIQQAQTHDNSVFKVVFTGNSVVAAHDCYFNQSYAHVFFNHFHPILKAAGITLEMENVGIGDNPCFGYDFCVKTFAGDNVDLITWDQLMDGQRGSHLCVEAFLRASRGLKGQSPLVALLDSGPNVALSRLRVDSTRRSVVESEHGNILEHYADYGVHYLSAGEALSNAIELADNQLSVSRVTVEGKIHGFKRWHPSPYGHEVFGLILASHYADIFMEAVKDYAQGISVPVEEKPAHFPRILHSNNMDMLDAKWIANVSCATSFQPKARQEMDLVNFVSPNSRLQNAIGNLKTMNFQEWEKDKWFVGISDREVFRKVSHAMIKGNYIDIKWSFTGLPSSGPLEISISIQSETGK